MFEILIILQVGTEALSSHVSASEATNVINSNTWIIIAVIAVLNILLCFIQWLINTHIKNMDVKIFRKNEIVKKINGRLEIWSNNAYYKSIGNKTISMMSPNWQGTILYIKIPLNKVILLDEIDNIESLNEQINFI